MKASAGDAFLLVLIFVSCSGACTRYEIQEDKQGRTIRDDKRTGEVEIIEGNKVIKPSTEPTSQEIQNLSQPREMGELALPPFDNVKAVLRLSLRENNLVLSSLYNPVSRKVAEEYL